MATGRPPSPSEINKRQSSVCTWRRWTQTSQQSTATGRDAVRRAGPSASGDRQFTPTDTTQSTVELRRVRRCELTVGYSSIPHYYTLLLAMRLVSTELNSVSALKTKISKIRSCRVQFSPVPLSSTVTRRLHQQLSLEDQEMSWDELGCEQVWRSPTPAVACSGLSVDYHGGVYRPLCSNSICSFCCGFCCTTVFHIPNVMNLLCATFRFVVQPIVVDLSWTCSQIEPVKFA